MKKLAILFHAHQRLKGRQKIELLADMWREQGIEVRHLLGTKTFHAADLLFMHVDLSVVPDEYLSFADRYPCVINRRAVDIRKSTYSSLKLGETEDWTGTVIVKSNLNFQGVPEYRLGKKPTIARRAVQALTPKPWRAGVFSTTMFDSLADVPRVWRSRKDLVVERFVPEMDNGLYHVRMYQFLGDRWTCTRLASQEPVVKGANCIGEEEIEPHPEVEQWRRTYGLDYGKIDYVVVEGVPILLDINKTIGAAFAKSRDPAVLRRRAHLAGGLSYYLRS